MDYLLSLIRVAMSAAMMLELVLCQALPAGAVQTDYAALEKRVAVVESAFADLEKITDRYREMEDELVLHLSASRWKEAPGYRQIRNGGNQPGPFFLR